MTKIKKGYIRIVVYFTRFQGNGSRYNVVVNMPKKQWLAMNDDKIGEMLDVMFSYAEKWTDAFTMVEWYGDMHNFSC